jgi:hypothetical protein
MAFSRSCKPASYRGYVVDNQQSVHRSFFALLVRRKSFLVYRFKGVRVNLVMVIHR